MATSAENIAQQQKIQGEISIKQSEKSAYESANQSIDEKLKRLKSAKKSVEEEKQNVRTYAFELVEYPKEYDIDYVPGTKWSGEVFNHVEDEVWNNLQTIAFDMCDKIDDRLDDICDAITALEKEQNNNWAIIASIQNTINDLQNSWEKYNN